MLAAMLSLAGMFGATAARAATYDVTLSGNVADFTQSQFVFDGFNFDQFSLPLTVVDSTLPITVAQGDSIDSTVTLDQAYTVPVGPARTYFLQYLDGASFPGGDTGVEGTFTFFNGGTEVAQYSYDSTTSNGLAAFAAVFAPSNPSFTFTSFTDDLTITSLATPGTLDSSSFEYDLLSNAVPEPATWGLMLFGFGLAGASLRRAKRAARAAV
jgi:hypothetical protein